MAPRFHFSSTFISPQNRAPPCRTPSNTIKRHNRNRYHKCSRGKPKASDEYSRGHSARAAISFTNVVSVAMKLQAPVKVPPPLATSLQGGFAKRMERLMRRAYFASTHGTPATCSRKRSSILEHENIHEHPYSVSFFSHCCIFESTSYLHEKSCDGLRQEPHHFP